VVLKVQTDGSRTPLVAVQEAINALIFLLGKIKGQFQQEATRARALEGTEDQFAGAGEGFF
jgi:DNA-directed RNA polymerase II subunit RPB11